MKELSQAGRIKGQVYTFGNGLYYRARPIEQERLAIRPSNYLALQNSYEQLAKGVVYEIGASFLTDQKRKTYLVYAACGDNKSVADPFVEEEEFKRLLENYDLNSLVTFHNHPTSPIPAFSIADIKIFDIQYSNACSIFNNQDMHRKSFYLYDAVASNLNRYMWQGFRLNLQ